MRKFKVYIILFYNIPQSPKKPGQTRKKKHGDFALTKIITKIKKTWFTGALYMLGALGYTFYAILWVIRFMQTAKRLMVAIVLILLASIAAGVYLFVPIHVGADPIEMTIEKGSSVHAIGRLLAARHVVPSSAVFVAWVKYCGEEKKIQAGKYVFFSGEGIISAAQKLQHAVAIDVSVTIPEGLTIEQTASIISLALQIDSAEFVRQCKDTAIARQCHVEAPTLEGYLFPDTYRFPPDVTIEGILACMTLHFVEKLKTLPPLSDTAMQFRLTPHEYVILASVVEREAALASERPHISSVFHNRLEKHMPLGADPTIRYALKKWNGPLLVSELAKDTPYNTRKYAGLPPGPICSPGLASLAAAMAPAQTKDLYFVAKWDGTGAHDFSMTNEEHCRKKNEIRKKNDLKKAKSVRERP